MKNNRVSLSFSLFFTLTVLPVKITQQDKDVYDKQRINSTTLRLSQVLNEHEKQLLHGLITSSEDIQALKSLLQKEKKFLKDEQEKRLAQELKRQQEERLEQEKLQKKLKVKELLEQALWYGWQQEYPNITREYVQDKAFINQTLINAVACQIPEQMPLQEYDTLDIHNLFLGLNNNDNQDVQLASKEFINDLRQEKQALVMQELAKKIGKEYNNIELDTSGFFRLKEYSRKISHDIDELYKVIIQYAQQYLHENTAIFIEKISAQQTYKKLIADLCDHNKANIYYDLLVESIIKRLSQKNDDTCKQKIRQRYNSFLFVIQQITLDYSLSELKLDITSERIINTLQTYFYDEDIERLRIACFKALAKQAIKKRDIDNMQILHEVKEQLKPQMIKNIAHKLCT